MLSTIEYIINRSPNLSQYTIDTICIIVDNKQLIYVTDTLLAWIGYTSNRYSHKLNKFKTAHFARYSSNSQYFIYNNNAYKVDLAATTKNGVELSIADYLCPVIDTSKYNADYDHVFITPGMLKDIIVNHNVNTPSGNQLKEQIDTVIVSIATYEYYKTNYAQKQQNTQLNETNMQLNENYQQLDKQNNLLFNNNQMFIDQIAQLNDKIVELQKQLVEQRKITTTQQVRPINNTQANTDNFGTCNAEEHERLHANITKLTTQINYNLYKSESYWQSVIQQSPKPVNKYISETKLLHSTITKTQIFTSHEYCRYPIRDTK